MQKWPDFSFHDAATVVFFFDRDRPIVDHELQGSASFLTLVPKFINDGQSFTTTGGFDGEKKDKAFTCTKLETFETISFKSNHEEADSRVWFHALTCTGRNILIFSPL